MGRPCGSISSLRACGAAIIVGMVYNVTVNNLPICTVGATDSHGGNAVTGSPNVFANGLPVCGLGDINDSCKWVFPHHYAQPLVLCHLNVFVS